MVMKVHPVAMIEIEVSPWSYDEKVKDGAHPPKCDCGADRACH